MIKCRKVKNPCKICLQTVSQKNGIQCQGACQNWVHYRCLNYTPGRIRDIKAGIIQINCPCPDCKSSLPKEFRTDEPYSCTNTECPANMPPSCINKACPSYAETNKMNQTSGTCRPRPLRTCTKDSCKEHVHPKLSPYAMTPQSSLSIGSTKCVSNCPSDQAGDSHRPRNIDLPSLSAVENMCNTVGQLTNQINDLMCRMKQVVKEKSAGSDSGGCCPKPNTVCGQKGPKSLCPKPCYCPGNPGNTDSPANHKKRNYR